MAKKYYYSHLIEIDTLHIALDSLDMKDEEKLEVKDLIEKNLYHTILEAILSELSEEDKKNFLSHLSEDDHEKIWGLLNNQVKNVEEKIKTIAEKVKKDIHDDIKSTKTSS